MRRHGPYGYPNYKLHKPWLRDEFEFRCVFCLCRESWGPMGQHVFSVDHFKPKSRYPNLELDYDDLLYACVRCNTLKRDSELLTHPCEKGLGQDVKLLPDGFIRPLNRPGI